ncbi:phage/plasmid primase, P4 family [Thauera propionica]|uniref:phage/plasmid primase, P4 family n=1 Tax=Thauera propionica TaxID=2019431 RepID=UPI0023F2973A|nr:phage/plasmid primase, P4 family [Thauera propionica]MDD3676785.1 phage/plasmid primase, P4 family [Thauera propionica]
MLDFNSVPPAASAAGGELNLQRDAIRADLLARLESVLMTLLPAGKKRGQTYRVGDVLGSPGDSLEVSLKDDTAGLWRDHATGEGGDIFDLIAAHHGLDAQTDFARVLEIAGQLVGRAARLPSKRKKTEPPTDELGPATAKWDYLDADDRLIAVVYRYDPPGRRKEFRPWDVKRRRMAPPDPRPLYNQPGIKAADQVILVEGEKCAQALIDAGFCATTAMHGANAPVDKTDWSPLAGKSVLIWPDHDKPGWAYAENAAKAVLKAGAIRCDILMPPDDKPEGWDAADAIAEKFDIAAFIATGPRITKTVEEEDSKPAAWFSDHALAALFSELHSEEWSYCEAWGKWLKWNGQQWKIDDTLMAQYAIRMLCHKVSLKADSTNLAARIASHKTISSVERIARADKKIATSANDWDADAWLLNTPGGTIDLRSGHMRPHAREDRITKITAATPKGDCPRWRTFLDDITGGDKELQSYLQRMVGYCLTGSTQEHALFFLYGTGANGKSVFVNTLSTILGDYAMTAPMDAFMDSHNERHPTELAILRGARLVTASETEQGRRWHESRIKAITGGDKISARFMRQDFFEYVPQFKLVIAGNHKPAIRNIDEAMKRRLHLIPFTLTIPPERRDKNLTEKLLKERDGILAWAVDGCIAWQFEGLNPPRRVVEATEEYFEAEDALGRWLEERCVRNPNATALTAELFSDWKQWAEAAGEFVGSQKRFADLLLTRGLEKWRNGMGLRGFLGVGLKETPKDRFTPYADN